jgi:hypothetical protein
MASRALSGFSLLHVLREAPGEELPGVEAELVVESELERVLVPMWLDIFDMLSDSWLEVVTRMLADDPVDEEDKERFARAFSAVTCARVVTDCDSSLGGVMAVTTLGLYPFPSGEVDMSGVGVIER